MSDFLSDFQKQFGAQISEKFSNRIDLSPEQAEAVAPALTPYILNSLKERAASSPADREALRQMIEHYQDNDEDPEGLSFSSPLSPAGAPLANMLGGNSQSAAGDIASKFGIPPELAGKLLPVLLPIIIGVLSQKNRGRAPGTTGGNAQGLPGMDILGQILGGGGQSGMNQSGCLSSLLGGLLKGKR